MVDFAKLTQQLQQWRDIKRQCGCDCTAQNPISCFQNRNCSEAEIRCRCQCHKPYMETSFKKLAEA